MDVPIFRLDRYTLPQAHSLTPVGQNLAGPAAVELEITRGRVQQRLRAVRSKVFLIGAANDSDLVLGDLQFPEAYAYLFVNGPEVSIRRLDAGPVLTVNGEPAQTAELFHGDRLAFGPFELRVRIAAAAARWQDSEDGSDDGAHDRTARRAASAKAPDEVESLLLDIRRGLAEDPPATDSVPAPHCRPLLPRVSSAPLRA